MNAAFPGVSRTADDCEKRWYSLQSHSRTEIAAYKRAISKTGEGSAPKPLSPVTSVVYSVLGSDTSITGIEGAADPAMQLLLQIEAAQEDQHPEYPPLPLPHPPLPLPRPPLPLPPPPPRLPHPLPSPSCTLPLPAAASPSSGPLSPPATPLLPAAGASSSPRWKKNEDGNTRA
ncbi:uncharacterized protein LOC132864650 [Neoarius graeffei]|uniref:uncharacterized protein LOC132864650 n=1 Tax=Neoarius graeffei TaxID=443677 RepID=UPI00298C2E87|nr:uncharacterized protein LOC132864650 [Neoarius graeffei]